jgi:hypothetical protein
VLPVLLLSAALAMQAAAPDSDASKGVHVNDYKGHYGKGLNPREEQFNATIVDAYHAKEQAVGNLEGAWRLSDATGKPLVQFELRAPKTRGGDIEGAWRSLTVALGAEHAGFVSSLTLSHDGAGGDDLEINYLVGHAHVPDVLHLQRQDDATWTGTLMDATGTRAPVVLQRLRALGG